MSRPSGPAEAMEPKETTATPITKVPGVAALQVATLVRSLGSGGVLTLGVLFFLSFRHLPAEQVGTALTIGGLSSVLASVPLGRLADGDRSRTVAVASLAAQGAATLGYLAVHTFPALVVAVCLVSVAEAGSNASRGALIAGTVQGKARVEVRARLRAITNAGSAVGAGLGSAVLGLGSPVAWVSAVVLFAACLTVGGLLICLVPKPRVSAAPSTAHPWEVLRDRRFAAFAMLNVVLTMNLGLLTVALPIWITDGVSTPSWIFGGLVILNTVLVVLLQVPVSRAVADVRSGGLALHRAGWLLGLSCVVFVLAGWPSLMAAAVALLLAGVFVHAIGEMLYSAGAWQLSYDMAPEHAHGQYQGMFTMSSQLGNAIAPALTVFLIAGFGGWGWLALGAAMVGAGWACVGVARTATVDTAAAPQKAG